MQLPTSTFFALGTLVLSVLGAPAYATTPAPDRASWVIHISVDGLRPDAVTALGPRRAPNFHRLRREGVYTDNARTDADSTITLPNHTSVITGRPVRGDAGHGYTANGMPAPDTTLHEVNGAYVASVFDVVHDRGMRTGLYASKEKFVVFDQSYDADNGAGDSDGNDDGRDKIDVYRFEPDSGVLVTAFIAAMHARPFHYSLLHLHDPDSAGHRENWDLSPGSAYLAAVERVDACLGALLFAIDADPTLAGNTTIILSADHGGRLGTIYHEPARNPENFTIPFYVWGRGIAQGADLYALNRNARADPGRDQPAQDAPAVPVRAADSANLALKRLGLPPVPGSTINARQDLALDAHGPPRHAATVD